MKNIRSHFVFNRSQQNGIFLLVVIIIFLQLVYYFYNFTTSGGSPGPLDEELVRLQQKIDSARMAGAMGDTVRIYPFNPNFITDYRGYTLGMSIEEIDRLHVYRAGDKWINSAEEFQKITGVSDSLLKVISPYFQFPEWVTSGRRNSGRNVAVPVTRPSAEKRNLNTAGPEDLIKVRGIGEVLAGRIVNYRSKIGGFVSDLQLKDIYGLSFEAREQLLGEFTVKEPPAYEIYNINRATVMELSSVPYIDYELAREIVNYRLLHEKIHTFEELSKINSFPSEKIDRIALYLTLE
ncbi:helix-hairpin-helix domain-containing protein [Antarcticibacterium flavum]|uniref:Helix-hairpin-helix domain-containing protein n=1 Tax=Antarcticibacterium flavum TaxID=2058175 RepID=A0A5B7X5M8_9FLAO|nr:MULTISPECIES: helix-hairpin-helix domain-containing protein [Antarcticibacterium]MCM4159725.1 DNA-binding protein [Antarcticibacterium sp. W02-3]QCY70659.1 helix-hairpin-helix domain-containing protein [Antarcticibacterium flavum]